MVTIETNEISDIEKKVLKLTNKGLIVVGYCSVLGEHKIFLLTNKEANNAYDTFGKKLKCGFMTKDEGIRLEKLSIDNSYFKWIK